MHELPITKSIFKSVIKKAEVAGAKSITRVVLEIGILRDFIPDLVQKYWDFISPGSIAEGSKIEIIEINAQAQCGQCGAEYTIRREDMFESKCPACGYRYGKLLSGDELKIKGIEIVKN